MIKPTPQAAKPLQLQFSIYLFALVLFIYTGASISLWYSSVWLWIKIILSLMLLIHGLIMLYRHLWLTSLDSIIALNYDGHHWQLQKKSGETCLTTLSGQSIVSSYFLLLRFQDVLSQYHYSVFIFPDTLAAQDFRSLRSTLAINA